jgi:hypothetical protein
LIVPSPCPCAASHSFVIALASATERSPSSDSVAFDELTNVPSPTYASGHVDVSSDGSIPCSSNQRPVAAGQRRCRARTPGELEVPLITGRHGHDRPGAVAHEHVVGDPHRDLRPVSGFVAYDPEKTPVFSRSSPAADVGLRLCGAPVACDRVGLRGTVSRSTSGCSGASTMNVAPNSVSGPGGEHLDRARPRVEHDLAPSDRPIQLRCIVLIESGQSSGRGRRSAVRVRGDAHHPLAHRCA